jgi:hypothetical protein
MSHILRIFGILPLLGMLAASLGSANALQIDLNSSPANLCAAGPSVSSGTQLIVSEHFDVFWFVR